MEPEPVELPLLSRSAKPSDRETAAFYRVVRGLRLRQGDDRPTPFACDWVAARIPASLSSAAIWRSLGRLTVTGVLEKVGELEGKRGKRGAWLYLPGEIPPERARVIPRPRHLRSAKPLIGLPSMNGRPNTERRETRWLLPPTR